jgi:hypothetical protein
MEWSIQEPEKMATVYFFIQATSWRINDAALVQDSAQALATVRTAVL